VWEATLTPVVLIRTVTSRKLVVTLTVIVSTLTVVVVTLSLTHTLTPLPFSPLSATSSPSSSTAAFLVSVLQGRYVRFAEKSLAALFGGLQRVGRVVGECRQVRLAAVASLS
jgi:hypothetical protein